MTRIYSPHKTPSYGSALYVFRLGITNSVTVVVRVRTVDAQDLASRLSNRAETALNNYWPIKEECTTTEGERVVLSLSGAQAKELIGAVSMI